MEKSNKTFLTIAKMVLVVVMVFMLNGLSANASSFSYKGNSFDTTKAIKTVTVDGISYSQFLMDSRVKQQFDLNNSDNLYLIYMSGNMTGSVCEYYSVICDNFPTVTNACIMMDCKFAGRVSNGQCTEEAISYYDNIDIYDVAFGNNFDTSNVTDMYCMFQGLEKIKSLDVRKLNTARVRNMKSMFANCLSLESVDLSRFNTALVEDMSFMFAFCESLEKIDVSSFNTSNVTNMRAMFGDCIRLKSLDVRNFNTCKVTNMRAMFAITSISDIDISNFNTSAVTSMKNMFTYCSNLTKLDMSRLNTPNVKDMSEMLDGCFSLQELDLSNQNIISDLKLDTCSDLAKIKLSNTTISAKNNLPTTLRDLVDSTEFTSLSTGKYDKILVLGACEHKNICKAVTNENLKSKATCDKPAVYFYECADCHEKLSTTYTYGKALGHKEKTFVTAATDKKDGAIVKKCVNCDKELSKTTIARAFVIVEDTVKYTGKAVKPEVKVVTANNKAIPAKFYTVSYKNNTKAGKASVTVKFKGNYTGTVTKNFTIAKKDVIPTKASGVKVEGSKASIKVSLNKAKGKVSGYEIQYSTDKNFVSGVTSVTVGAKKAQVKTISKLKAKTNYYVRVRTFTKDGKNNVYSAWTVVKNAIKTK